MKPAPVEASPLQRRVMALIPHIPDPMLEVLYYQLAPMVDAQVQQKVMLAFRATAAENNHSPASPEMNGNDR